MKFPSEQQRRTKTVSVDGCHRYRAKECLLGCKNRGWYRGDKQNCLPSSPFMGIKAFFIPKNYDDFLTKRYGNYMEFPPESEVYECCDSIVECEL